MRDRNDKMHLYGNFLLLALQKQARCCCSQLKTNRDNFLSKTPANLSNILRFFNSTTTTGFNENSRSGREADRYRITRNYLIFSRTRGAFGWSSLFFMNTAAAVAPSGWISGWELSKCTCSVSEGVFYTILPYLFVLQNNSVSLGRIYLSLFWNFITYTEIIIFIRRFGLVTIDYTVKKWIL